MLNGKHLKHRTEVLYLYDYKFTTNFGYTRGF